MSSITRPSNAEAGPGNGNGSGDASPADPDVTLSGYLVTHHRPPAFLGSDGHPYTVSIECEKTPDLTQPYSGFLVFPRWAAAGMGIVGHLETPTLWKGCSAAEVMTLAGRLKLTEVRRLLDRAIQDAASEASPGKAGKPGSQE